MPLDLAPSRRPHDPQPPELSLDLVRRLALSDSFESYEQGARLLDRASARS